MLGKSILKCQFQKAVQLYARDSPNFTVTGKAKHNMSMDSIKASFCKVLSSPHSY